MSSITLRSDDDLPIFDFRDFAPELAFYSRSEISKWLSDEAKRWEWLSAQVNALTAAQQSAQKEKKLNATKALPAFKSMNQFTREKIQQLANDSRESGGIANEDVSRRFREIYRDDRVPMSGTREWTAFEDWSARDPEGCVHALQAWLGMSWTPVDTDGNFVAFSLHLNRLGNWIRGSLMRHGLPELGVPSSLTVEDIKREFSAYIKAEKKKSSDLTQELGTLRTSIANHEERFLKFKEASEAEHKAVVKASDERLKALETKYQQELTVRSAEWHWQRRALWCSIASILWMVAFLAVLSTGAYGLYNNLDGIGKIGPETKAMLAAGAEAHPAATAVAVREWLGSATRTALIIAMFVWPMRLIVRNYLSMTHLATDAKERAMIVRTYLAILDDERLKGDDEVKKILLAPVLESLFRHTPDGIVKDDLMPWTPTVTNDLVKNFTGGK